MQAVGIIAEYNTFHNGHHYQVNAARRLSDRAGVIAVMSGNFVQRGEPAIFDKWARAEMAVAGGVDLVLELPFVFAVRSAQHFAAGAVRLLRALGIVSHISFGAELADLAQLTVLSRAIANRETIDRLQHWLSNGCTYAAGLGAALAEQTGLPRQIVAAPNNILAIEYLRAIDRYAPALIPVPVARYGAAHHDVDVAGPIASATAIRQTLATAHPSTVFSAIPAACVPIIEKLLQDGRGPVDYQAFTQAILAQLRLTPLDRLARLPDMSEGLHNKLKSAALAAADLAEFIALVKTKRYPRTRLQRFLVHALLGSDQTTITSFDECGPLYARVLALNDRGRLLLREIEQNAAIPCITKTTHFLNSKTRTAKNLAPLPAMLAIDTLVTDIYVLGLPNPRLRQGGWDFRLSPRYLSGAPATE